MAGLPFSAILTMLRNSYGLSARSLAQCAGLSNSAISGIERRDFVRGPQNRTLDEIAKFFEIRPEDLKRMQTDPFEYTVTHRLEGDGTRSRKVQVKFLNDPHEP